MTTQHFNHKDTVAPDCGQCGRMLGNVVVCEDYRCPLGNGSAVTPPPDYAGLVWRRTHDGNGWIAQWQGQQTKARLLVKPAEGGGHLAMAFTNGRRRNDVGFIVQDEPEIAVMAVIGRLMRADRARE